VDPPVAESQITRPRHDTVRWHSRISELVGLTNAELGLLLAITGMAASLRFATLSLQSYWFDEAVTVDLVRHSFLGMLRAIPDTESTPPLYYVLGWGWSRIFGTGEIGLRSLSALLGTATVPVSFAVGRILVSRRAGLLAAALVACSPMLVWYSQEARSYALLAFLSVLSVLAFVHAGREPTRRALVLWSAVASLALTTHYFAIFLVAAEGLWLLVTRRRHRSVWIAVGATGAVGTALLPLALHQHNTGQTWWIGARPLSGRIRETATQFVTGAYAPPHHGAAVAGLAAVLGVAAGLAWFADTRERRGVVVLLALGGFAVLAPLALAPTGYDNFFYRNLIGAWVVLAIAAAAVLGSRRAGRFGVALLTAACALQLGALTVVLLRPSLQRDDWRSATRALDPVAGPLAIVTNPSFERVSIELYRSNVRAMPQAGATVREIDFLGRARLPLEFRPPMGFQLVEQRRIQHIALVRFRSAGLSHVTPSAIASGSRFGAQGVLLEPTPQSR
jgi:mannosyltransferase